MNNSSIIFSHSINLMNSGALQGTGETMQVMDLTTGETLTVEIPETIHTYAYWKSCGYQVQRGEKAIAQFDIWKSYSRKVEINPENENDSSEPITIDKTFFKLVFTSFFAAHQVKPVDVDNVKPVTAITSPTINGKFPNKSDKTIEPPKDGYTLDSLVADCTARLASIGLIVPGGIEYKVQHFTARWGDCLSCCGVAQRIRINKYLFENSYDGAVNTMIHEMLHAIDGGVSGHTGRWLTMAQKVTNELGIHIKRTSSAADKGLAA